MTKATKEELIKIQAEHLCRWGTVLKPECHQKLVALVAEKQKGNYDIIRGCAIDEIVYNELMQ